MTSSSPLRMFVPFPMLVSAPIGAPDWVGDMTTRAGNALVHPRRVWAWEMDRDDSVGPSVVNPQAPSQSSRRAANRLETLLESPQSPPDRAVSRSSTVHEFSILEHTDDGDVSSLPGSSVPSRLRLAVPSSQSLHSGMLMPSLPTSSSISTPSSHRILPTVRTIKQTRVLEPRTEGSPHLNRSYQAEFSELDDFSPPITSTPLRPGPSSTITPRRRGLSLASLSLRRRPQNAVDSLPRSGTFSLGRRSGSNVASNVASISKRSHMSSISRSYSSRSFFSSRTFGAGPTSPEQHPQKTVTDIDLIACMARNLVESASPIRYAEHDGYDEDYEDEYAAYANEYDNYDSSYLNSSQRSYYRRSTAYDYSFIRGYYADETRPEDEFQDRPADVSNGSITRAEIAMADIDRARFVEQRRHNDRYRVRRHQSSSASAKPQHHDHSSSGGRAAQVEDAPQRLDRALHERKQHNDDIDPNFLSVARDRRHRRSDWSESGQSGTSASSGLAVPKWLAPAIRIRNTPNRPNQSDPSLTSPSVTPVGQRAGSSSDEAKGDRIWEDTTDTSQTTDDDESDKENYHTAHDHIAYLKRASTSAFGPSPPAPSKAFPRSVPTTPKQPVRGEAWRASWAGVR